METTISGEWPNGGGESIAEKRKAFEKAAREHQPTLLRIANHMCKGNNALAQDLVQDALISGYQGFLNGSFKEGNIRAWLIRILTNAFLNDYRRRKRWESDVEINEEISMPIPENQQPDVSALDAIYDAPIEDALQSLPEHQRMCVYLVDVEEMNYDEAAQSLGVPVGTVRSRLARGRVALFEKLKDYGKQKGYLK